MVQVLEGRRARNRIARYDAYLATATHVVSTEGLDALTMQRLAGELDCAVGTIYTYFPSKSALVAEVQRAAIERLKASLLLLLADADADPTGASAGPLVPVVAFGRFAIAAVDVFPEESRLLQLLTAEVHPTLAPEDALRVLPVAMEYLEIGRTAIATATAAKALRPGDAMQRTVTLTAALNGVLMISRLSRWDEDLLNVPRLAHDLLIDLVAGWGGDRTAIAAADRVLDRLEVTP